MRFGAYVLFMLGIAIAFMLAGKTNALFYVLGIDGQGPGPEATSVGSSGGVTGSIPSPGYGGVPVNMKDMGARFISILINPTSIGILVGLSVVAAGVSLLGGVGSGVTSNLTSFAALYFVPIVMFFFFANMLLVPVDQYLQQANCPGQYSGDDPTLAITGQQCGSAQMPGAIYYPVLAIYNLCGIMALISFFKGGI